MTQPITPEKLRELSQIASEFGHTVYADALKAAADALKPRMVEDHEHPLSAWNMPIYRRAIDVE